MPTFDLAKLLPYLLAGLAIAIAVGWFVAHDRAVAAKAVALDRAGANEAVIELQKKALDDKQKVIDYADELSKVRYAELLTAKRAAEQYRGALAALATDPDVARVLGTRLPQSLRELRRTHAATASGSDRVPVLHEAGIRPADAGAGAAGRDGGRAAGREPAAAGGAPIVQPGQGQGAPADRQPAPTPGFQWPNFLNWFNPAPARSTP